MNGHPVIVQLPAIFIKSYPFKKTKQKHQGFAATFQTDSLAVMVCMEKEKEEINCIFRF